MERERDFQKFEFIFAIVIRLAESVCECQKITEQSQSQSERREGRREGALKKHC